MAANGIMGMERASRAIRDQTPANMGRHALFAFGCCLFIACSATIADTEARFHFDGQVSTESGSGLSGVEVYFIDTGLDEWASKTVKERAIGRTDETGRLSYDLPYPSGYSRRNGGSRMP